MYETEKRLKSVSSCHRPIVVSHTRNPNPTPHSRRPHLCLACRPRLGHPLSRTTSTADPLRLFRMPLLRRCLDCLHQSSSRSMSLSPSALSCRDLGSTDPRHIPHQHWRPTLPMVQRSLPFNPSPRPAAAANDSALLDPRVLGLRRARRRRVFAELRRAG